MILGYTLHYVSVEHHLESPLIPAHLPFVAGFLQTFGTFLAQEQVLEFFVRLCNFFWVSWMNKWTVLQSYECKQTPIFY